MDPTATILIVDDEPVIRHALVTLLRRHGYGTLTAETGEQGSRIARELQPHLILLNIQLPGKNGWEVQRELAADPVTQSIPVVAITGFPSGISRNAAIENGFSGFLEKPFRYSQLIAALDQVLAAPGT
jgi:CheY-like chemotaxis protein